MGKPYSDPARQSGRHRWGDQFLAIDGRTTLFNTTSVDIYAYSSWLGVLLDASTQKYYRYFRPVFSGKIYVYGDRSQLFGTDISGAEVEDDSIFTAYLLLKRNISSV